MENATRTATLTEFLLQRVAEDEARASETHLFDCVLDHLDGRDGCSCIIPARVLAECEAKRRIVELRYSWNLQAERVPEPPFGPILKAQVITADSVLRTLAAVYRDHPDHRVDWS